MNPFGRIDTLLESLRALAGTGIEIVQTRLRLIGLELEVELHRARTLLIQSFAVLLLALLAVGFTGCALIATFWDSHRILASWLVAGIFLTLVLVASIRLIRNVRAGPQPFAETLHQLEQDIAALRRRQ